MVLDEVGDGLDVDRKEFGDRAGAGDGLRCKFEGHALCVQDRQRHHGRTVDARRAVDIEFRRRIGKRIECEVEPWHEDVWWLGLVVIIDGDPTDRYVISTGEWAVIEFELHVQDMGHTGTDEHDHTLVVPDGSADGDLRSDP